MTSQFPPRKRAKVILMGTNTPSEADRVRTRFEHSLAPVDLREVSCGCLGELCNEEGPWPDLILLSTSDPEAVETLKALKASRAMGSIPTALLMSPGEERSLGAFPLTPIPFEEMMGETLHPYWFAVVEPPVEGASGLPKADPSFPEWTPQPIGSQGAPRTPAYAQTYAPPRPLYGHRLEKKPTRKNPDI